MASPRPFWNEPVPALLARLHARPAGLLADDARARLAAHGVNRVADATRHSALRLLIRQFASPLVLILVFGALVSLVVHERLEATIILAIVAGSALLGFLQEHRASRAIAALRARLALTAHAVRDGGETVVAAADLVPGDVIRLSAGDLVPADGVVLDARDFLVSEAALTGEPFPVEKSPGVSAADAAPAERRNAVFLGSSVRSGSATVLIVATGSETTFGALASHLRDADGDGAFARGLTAFGTLLLRVMLVMVVFVLAVNHLLGRAPIDSLLYAVALAVGLSPELLPAIVSVTLARGARAMAAQGVLVRRLEAIEDLGAIDVLCTDKTGTLTTARVRLDEATDPEGAPSPAVLELAFVNAALETGIENPIDAALVEAGRAAGHRVDGLVKLDEIPYDFLRRRLTIVVAARATPDAARLVCKGAFPEVLAACTHVATPAGARTLDDAARGRLSARFAAWGDDGFRVLAVAHRDLPRRPSYARSDERDLVFDGFLLLADPPKPEAAATVRALAQLGIDVRIVTGDNRHVAAHVAREVGLDAHAMLTGDAIRAMRDDALRHRARHATLFAEVDPEQKERVVRALARGGRTVGFLGDGVNDAPALHAADVGISVEGAADVARESADVVLVRADLEVLRAGVATGRRAFANTLKYIAITTSANFGNMVSMAIATPLLPFLPLAAKQILLNNLLSDVPSVAIGADAVDAERVAHAQRFDAAAIRRFMIAFGLVSSLFDLATFWLLLVVFRADEPTFRTVWFVVSVATELAVVLVLRTRRPAWRSRPAPLLLGATLVVGAVAFALPFVPPVAALFDFVAPTAPMALAIVAIVLAYVAATEAAKLAGFGHARPHARRRPNPGGSRER